MGSFPPYHVARLRLTTLCGDARVVVAEAGAGYGKSTFARELVDSWRGIPVEVELLGNTSPQLFASRLQHAVAKAGFSEAARTVARSGNDPQAVVEAVLESLGEESCSFVIDDAHHADRECAQLITFLAQHLVGSERCVILSRRLPEGAERLRRAEFLQLGAVDLALRPDETLLLCRSGFGLDAGTEDAKAIDDVTGGWTAATVLALARAKRSGEPIRTVARDAVKAVGTASPVAAILDEVLAALGAEECRELAQVALLPLVDQAIVAVALGDDTYFERTAAAGVPWTQRSDGWWELPGPVQDYLASLAPPDPVVLETAALEYRRRGELSAALSLLLRHGLSTAAADLLATSPDALVFDLDVLEVESVVGRLPDIAVEAHPMVLVQLARLYQSATLVGQRESALRRVEQLGAVADDSRLARAIAAERAKDLVRDGEFREAEVLAGSILGAASDDETTTRAGALSALGRALCFRRDADGRCDLTALAKADEHLAAAHGLYLELGMTAPAALLAPYRAIWVEFARGNARSALRLLDDALELVVDTPRPWGLLQVERAEVQLELGLFDDHDAAVADALRVGDMMDDDVLRSYAYWDQAIGASHRGDADATHDLLRATERHASQWWDYASGEYYASAADCLARVGDTATAWEYLENGLADPQDTSNLLAMTEGVLLARSGDPAKAEAALRAAPGAGVAPREFWRISLMRALAAFRRGDRAAGALAARAFEEAASLGLDQLPLTKERAVTEELLGLAVETGRPAALALEGAALPTLLAVLGDFALTRGGRQVALTPGQGTKLLKMLAVTQRRLLTEHVIDTLWPEADREAGRNRLRTVLTRLRSEVGDVVLRDGEMITLAPDTRVDLAQFETEARKALALGSTEPTLAVAWARSAIARYRGEVLADEPYEDWAIMPREWARRTMLQLLDLCADVARLRGDLDEMRRVVEMTIDFAPYEDDRYLRAASLLLDQGNRGAALTVLRRARSALADLGLEAPASVTKLERQIVA